MAKINILFDNKNYNIDESAFSSASAKLKSHLSTVMNGTGAVINIGGVPYNVDSAKLSTAMNAFTTHLGTISGSGSKLVVNGVQYNINSAKLSDAITELHDVLGGLHSDGGSGDSGMNEYGFYFGVPYSATIDVDGGVYKLIYVFHEDGSANFKLYIDGVLSEEESGGSVVYDQNKATFPDGMVIIFTENGTKFVDPNDITCTLESSSTSSLNEYGFYFDKTYSFTEEEDGVILAKYSYVFYEDGSFSVKIEDASGEVFKGTGYATYIPNKIIIEGDEALVTDNGTKIDFGDGTIATLESSNVSGDGSSSGISWGQKYTSADSNSYVFYEDGSVECYVGDEIITSREAGFYKYVVNEDGTTSVLVLSEDGESYTDHGHYVTADGKTFYIGGDVNVPFTLESSSTTSLNEYGFYYDTKYSLYNFSTNSGFPVGEIGVIFKENATADMYLNNTFLQTVPVTYSDEIIIVSSLGATLSVRNNGKELHDPLMATFKLGDAVIIDGDYTYKIVPYTSGLSWDVMATDKTKSSYGTIKNEIDGYPVVALSSTFENCTNLTIAPAIPPSTIKMVGTFRDCNNLTTAPVIPSNVINMTQTFMHCDNLTGNIEINANPTEYEGCFYGIEKPITIIGLCSDETKAALAATELNGNVSY